MHLTNIIFAFTLLTLLCEWEGSRYGVKGFTACGVNCAFMVLAWAFTCNAGNHKIRGWSFARVDAFVARLLLFCSR